MGKTDCFKVEIDEEEIGVSESRTNGKKIYRLEVDEIKYTIESKFELDRKYWYVYVENHPNFRHSLVHKNSSGISFAWKWVRDDIKKRISEDKIS